MKKRVPLLIDPLDVLFFRDGRPFTAGMRGKGGLPLPQTLAGALRTKLWSALGMDFSRLPAALEAARGKTIPAAAEVLGPEQAWAAEMRVYGPWLCRCDGDSVAEVFLPLPADLAGDKGQQSDPLRLRPLEQPPPAWRPPTAGLLPLWHRGRQQLDKIAGYLGRKGLEKYLAGDVPARSDLVGEEELVCWEDRSGIVVDPGTGTAADHLLYSVRLLRLKNGVFLYAEVEFPQGCGEADPRQLLAGTVPFGGEGRQVRLNVLDRGYAWPRLPGDKTPNLAYLVTPAIFLGEDNRLPDRENLPALVAAAVPGSIPVSGWDLALRRPKPVRQAVAPGSVFMFAGDLPDGDGDAFTWLGQDQENRALGFGLALKGAWNHG